MLPDVVIFVTSGAASHDNFVKIMTFRIGVLLVVSLWCKGNYVYLAWRFYINFSDDQTNTVTIQMSNVTYQLDRRGVVDYGELSPTVT